MAPIGVLSDSVTELATTLDGVAGEVEAVSAALRELVAQDVGPPNAGAAVADALVRLERRLSTLTEHVLDASLAARRHLAEPTAQGDERAPAGRSR